MLLLTAMMPPPHSSAWVSSLDPPAVAASGKPKGDGGGGGGGGGGFGKPKPKASKAALSFSYGCDSARVSTNTFSLFIC